LPYSLPVEAANKGMGVLITNNIKRVLIFAMLYMVSVVLHAENKGEQLYVQSCVICHAVDGTGAMPGVPNLIENRAWSGVPEKELLDRLERGIQTPGATIAIPPKGGNSKLSDKELMEIVTYMRATFIK